METETLRDLRMRPRAAVVMPLPTELTTPPVTKMYLGIRSSRRRGPRIKTNGGTVGECRPPAMLQGDRPLLQDRNPDGAARPRTRAPAANGRGSRKPGRTPASRVAAAPGHPAGRQRTGPGAGARSAAYAAVPDARH